MKIRAEKAALTSLLLVSVFTACRRSPPPVEERPVSWLNPSDQALMDAATAGYQGQEPKGIWLKETDSPTQVMCQDGISSVALYTPLWSAQLMGYNARKRFENAPTLASVTKQRYSSSIFIYYGARRPDDEANLAVSVEGKLYKGVVTSKSQPETISCGEYESPRWSLGMDTSFTGPDALPTSGKGTVIVRRDGMEDTNIDIDFDSIPTSFALPSQQ